MTSAAAERVSPLRSRIQALDRARLAVVHRTRVQAPRFPFVTLVTLILLGGVVGLLCFNTSMQQASFAATALDERASTLAARQQTLEMELEQLRDPQRIAVKAQQQGLVMPTTVAMLEVPSGKVVGTATPADRGNTPPLWPKVRRPSYVSPAAQAAAQQAAAARAAQVRAARQAAEARLAEQQAQQARQAPAAAGRTR